MRFTGGANSKNICFGRTAKFIRKSEDIAGNREPREIIRETANNIGILHIIIQQIVTMPIYGKEALNICHLYMTDILRYT